HLALALRQCLEREVDAPLHPGPLGALVRAGVERRLFGRLRRRLVAGAAAVDNRVSSDSVEPRGAGPALGLVRPRGAPDGNERLLERVLGAAAVAQATQREAEDGTRVALVQLLEGRPVARPGPLDQLRVRAHERNPRLLNGNRHLRCYGVDR